MFHLAVLPLCIKVDSSPELLFSVLIHRRFCLVPRPRIWKLLRSLGIVSKESIPPACSLAGLYNPIAMLLDYAETRNPAKIFAKKKGC
jgi:hypothetical protein